MEQSTVTVIGVGLIGSAVARAFIGAGYEVTLWNRTPEKVAPFQGQARIADTVAEACAVSDTIVVSVLNYQVSNDLLRTTAVEEVIAGKTLVQLMTGTPSDARGVDEWARQHDLAYLDGVIGGPSSAVGKESTTIFYSGEPTVFERAHALLSVMGTPSFVGEAIGAAAALNIALMGIGYSLGISLLHGAAVCAAEGIPLVVRQRLCDRLSPWASDCGRMAEYATAVGCTYQTALDAPLEVYFTMTNLPTPVLDEGIRDGPVAERPPVTPALAAQAMARPRTYREAGLSSITTYAVALEDMIRASREAGVDSVFLDAFLTCFQKVIARGHGPHDLAALYEAFVPE